MKFKLITFVLVLTVQFLHAQEDVYHPELEWRTIQTDHFYIHYHLGIERTARVVAKIAEEIYEPITSLYHYKPDGRVSFIIKDYDDYSNGGTYFFDNKIEIWSSALDYDLRGTHNWLRNVISHEYTHMIQVQSALKFGKKVPAVYFQWLQYESERRTDVLYGYPNGIVSYPISGFIVPAWFAEGTAQYNRKEFAYESWDTHRDMILRMYALDSSFLTWNQMCTFGKTSLGNESSYNAGYALVRYIAERYGEDKLREISNSLSSMTTFTIDQAIQKAIGISGEALYREWTEYLQKDFTLRSAAVKEHLVAGSQIASVGFVNFYPTISPDGKKIAYISNKEHDYFGLSSLYLYDTGTKQETLLVSGVLSNNSWSPDGAKIYYAKNSPKNPHWSAYLDLYEYDIRKEHETRLTHGLRAGAPAVSPDGKQLAFILHHDGTLNLGISNIDGTDVKQLTHYSEGEQVYNPKWSPDGTSLVFDYSVKDGRDIAIMNLRDTTMQFVLATPDDERNAVFTPDGKALIYSSDKTGIFNLYKYDWSSKTSVQVTNVLGAAVMPSVDATGKIAFASYTSTGYKISFLENATVVDTTIAYGRPTPIPQAAEKNAFADQQFDWNTLTKYDDTQVPSFKETEYKNTSTGLELFPLIRVDNYNPKNRGIDVVKVGTYGYSYDVLDRYGFFAGLALNLKLERDLFFTFDYRGKVPGLYQLGLEPQLAFEFYNIVRKTNTNLSVREDLNIPVDVTYNLIEFDVAAKHKLLLENLDLELRYTHSRYTANIETFTLHDTLGGGDSYLISAYGTTYLKGNTITLNLKFNGIHPSRTQEINPVGRKMNLRYAYEFASFNPNDSIINGQVISFYKEPRFHRLELEWRESIRLPGWKHTLSSKVAGGTIFGPPVDDFFNFYIGGLAGMKGYTFYSLGGNEYAVANCTYRFPIIEDIDKRFLHIIFNHIYGAVYGDVGSAWTGGGPSGVKFKKDAGAELRIEATSYYAFPTRIFFNATYGFDQFKYTVQGTGNEVTYGREWNFHFGVLFGFDLD
jgi:Tol biopolymer transport system component